MSHFASVRFNGFAAQIQEFTTLPATHLAAVLLLDSKLDIDAVAVNAPWEFYFLAKQTLGARDNVNHRVVRDGADVPSSRWVGWRRVNYEQLAP